MKVERPWSYKSTHNVSLSLNSPENFITYELRFPKWAFRLWPSCLMATCRSGSRAMSTSCRATGETPSPFPPPSLPPPPLPSTGGPSALLFKARLTRNQGRLQVPSGSRCEVAQLCTTRRSTSIPILQELSSPYFSLFGSTAAYTRPTRNPIQQTSSSLHCTWAELPSASCCRPCTFSWRSLT